MYLGLTDILVICFIAFCMFISKKIWYSGLLFGKYACNNHSRKATMLLLCESLIQAFIVHVLTMNMYYLLPSYFFTFVVLIILLVLMNDSSKILQKNNQNANFLVSSSITIISLMLGFLISLFYQL